jgi:uncharacterized protein YbaR (Trm112 family)
MDGFDMGDMVAYNQRRRMQAQQQDQAAALNRQAKALETQNQEMERVASLPKCVDCRSPLEFSARVCSACRAEVYSVPGSGWWGEPYCFQPASGPLHAVNQVFNARMSVFTKALGEICLACKSNIDRCLESAIALHKAMKLKQSGLDEVGGYEKLEKYACKHFDEEGTQIRDPQSSLFRAAYAESACQYPLKEIAMYQLSNFSMYGFIDFEPTPQILINSANLLKKKFSNYEVEEDGLNTKFTPGLAMLRKFIALAPPMQSLGFPGSPQFEVWIDNTIARLPGLLPEQRITQHLASMTQAQNRTKNVTSKSPKAISHYQLTCPACSKKIKIPTTSLGNMIACPSCQQQITTQEKKTVSQKPKGNSKYRINCPSCSKALQVAASSLGKTITCSACKQKIQTKHPKT